MADDLDQGYMQTRQTMRDWQNRMLFMETTQEGNQVHMGVQVGGKPGEGAPAGPPGQDATPQPPTKGTALPPDQEAEFQKWYVGIAQQTGNNPNPDDPQQKYDYRGFYKSGQSPAPDPTDVDPETGQARLHFTSQFKHDDHPNRFVNTDEGILDSKNDKIVTPEQFNKLATTEQKETVQKKAQPRTITVDTPEVAAVKQQFSAHMQEVASGEAGMKALGKGGKALAEAARPGFETAAIALGMDEEAAATVGQAFVEFMGGLPSDDSTDLQAGFETAIAVLPAVGAMYKSGKMFGKAAVEGLTKNREAIIQEFRKAGDILKSERGSVPLGGGGAGKPPDVPPVNIGGAAEEPISPKALATISRREQAKSDFTIKVEGFKDEITKQRRGPVLSDEAVRKLAGESGFTLQDLLDLKPGSILAPEIQVAARDVFKASADKMKASAKAYLERADPQAFDEFAQAFAEAGIATTRIIGTFAEGGRTFRLFNQKYPTLKTGVKPDVKDPEFSIQDQYIQEMYKFFRAAEEKSKMGGFAEARSAPGAGSESAKQMQSLLGGPTGGTARENIQVDITNPMSSGMGSTGGMVSPGQLAQMVMDLPNEEAMMKFAKEAVKPTWGDMMMEVWINGLLSGPITHSTNIISNAATLAWNIPERAVASMLNPKAVRPGEAAAMMGGVVESMGDAWRLAWKAFKEEQPQFGQAKLEMPRRAITADALEVTGMTGRAVDFLGAAVRLPGRFLMAGDDFFKAIAFRAELRALAKRQAFREINEMSLTGKAAAQKAREIEKNILDNPPESIKEAAQEFAAYTTFTRDLGETGQKVQALASTPIGRIVMPFVRTPTNIFKFAGERTPLALASRAVREEIAAGGERRALALAKIGLGSMTMAYMSTLAANGLITGGGPKDKTLRQIKMQTGWKPYSFKIGNEYISYARIEPLGSLFGLAADAADIMGQLSEADAAKLASALTVAISRNVAQKTFVKGLAGTLNAVTSQEVKQVNSFLEKELPTILPYSSALGQTAKNVDPVMREVNSIMDAFKAKIPGYSSDLPPHRNLWGEPVLLEGGLGPDLLSPFYSSTVKDDKVAAELDRLQAPITLPSKQIDRVPLTPKQYDRYQILAAHPQGMPSLREKLEEVIASDLYKHGTDDPADGGKITLLKMWVDNYRDLAKFQLRQEDADLDAKLRERETKKAGAFAGTAPGGLSR